MEKGVTEDIWLEIFLHLPLYSIFKCKCVCTLWLSILSNPNFINQWYKHNTSLLPWMFVHAVDSIKDNPLRRKFTIAYPESHSLFLSQHQSGFFLNQKPNNPYNELLDRIYLIGSSNGLVLCTTSLFSQVTYYVCSPLAKKWVLLPPPPPAGFDLVVTGFMCNECFSSPHTSYNVIRIPKFEAAVTRFNVVVFSSDVGEWDIRQVSCSQDVTWEYSPYNNVVTHNGVLYWFQKEKSRILAFKVNKTNNCGNECRLINLPDPAMVGGHISHCLGESEGLICYTRIKYTDRSISIWVLEEDWCLLHKDIKLHGMLAEMQSWLLGAASIVDLIREIQVLGFNPVDKNVVILGCKKYIWAYNTSTREYEQLRHPSTLGSNLPSVPHLSVLAFALKPKPTILPPICWRD